MASTLTDPHTYISSVVKWPPEHYVCTLRSIGTHEGMGLRLITASSDDSLLASLAEHDTQCHLRTYESTTTNYRGELSAASMLHQPLVQKGKGIVPRNSSNDVKLAAKCLIEAPLVNP